MKEKRIFKTFSIICEKSLENICFKLLVIYTITLMVYFSIIFILSIIYQ